MLLEHEVQIHPRLMEPSDEEQEIKAKRDRTLGTRLKELQLDLQGKQRQPMKGVQQEGVGPDLNVRNRLASTQRTDGKAGVGHADSRGVYSLPGQLHTHSGDFHQPFQAVNVRNIQTCREFL